MTVATVTTGEHHPIAWYGEMKPREKNTFWACTGGWILDAMDVQIFSFAIPAIIAAFAITNAEAGLIGTATLLTSAFGGWFAGALSVRFGGEWAAAAVLIGEVIRPQHRGKAVGAMQSGWAIGWGIAALLATLFFTVMPA